MMPGLMVVVPVWVERLGWMLVHSLWQLAIIAILAAVLLRLLRSRSAQMRYAVSVAMLSLIAAGPVVTWCMISVEPVTPISLRADERPVPAEQAASVVRRPVTTEAGSAEFEDVKPVAAVTTSLAADTPEMNTSASNFEIKVDSAGETFASATLPDVSPASTASVFLELIHTMARAIKPRLPILVGVWLLGVLICSVRPVWGLWIHWRLRHMGLRPVPESIQSTLNVLIRKLRLSRAVRIAESALVKVPLVVGYLHPMILLPTSVITGLTSSQLEAVLAHELAHVRRHDWLINTLQVIAETLLFYHPAVWWLSSRIRQERELCCDDIALGLNIDKAVFARTLLTLEELRQTAPAPSMAATGGDLAARVRRLLITTHTTPSSGEGTILGMLVVVMSLILMVTSLFASGPSDETQKSFADSAAEHRDDDAMPDAIKDTLLDAGQKENPDPKPNNARHRTIRVLDENEKPVVGAEVRLQFQHDSETSFNIDGIISATTDEKGIVVVEAPAESDSLLVTVTADGFGEFSDRQQATGESIVRITGGRVIHVRAVDESGSVLGKAVPLLTESRVWGREFMLQEDGTFKSPAVDLKRRLMRVVTAQENGPFLFSDLIDVAEAQAGPDGILEVVLKPGTKFTGRLDDSVPRPISEGYVQLMVVEGPNRTLTLPVRDERYELIEGSWRNPWTWQDSAAVQPDGTFTFESVPSGGVAQIHVAVDGFMSVNPPIEELAATIQAQDRGNENVLEGLKQSVESRAMWPHLVPMNAEHVETTIKCGPTASCDFRILDPSGNPMPDATMSFSPNGIFINGKLFIPGSESFQNASLVHDLFWDIPPFAGLNGQGAKTPRDAIRTKEREWARRSFLDAKSDKDGRVRIRNLPGGVREGYRVTADGFVLPRSPLFPPLDDRREGYVDLVAGETIEATIYLERDQPVVEREILVVDMEGSPLPNVTVALAEMRIGEKNWQQWSTQRFGAAQTANTDNDGRVTLQVPSVIDSLDVERIRLAVNLRTNDLWVNGELVDAPLKPDSGLIAIVPDLKSERRGRAKYGELNEILIGANSGQLLQSMIRKPSLAILRQLLSVAKSKQPEPVELLDEGRFGQESKGARVHLIPSGESLFALVGARVRPADGTRKNEEDMSKLPECVFVFDSDGNPVAALGGEIGTTGAGSPDSTDIMCLGPEEDWFVRVTRFQNNGPFVYQSVYYRVGDPLVSSLKYYHYANSNSWSNGPEKITRHGDLNFEFPDSRNDYAGQTVGLTAEAVAVNGTIFWDGDKNQFFGAPAQSVDGRPLYKVDTEWSRDFSALKPKADQMVLSGGIREYDHWYGWNTVVPQGYEAVVRVSIPQPNGDPQILEQTLAAGRHMIQFQAKPSDDGMTATLQLGYGKDEQIQNADLPFGLADQQHASAIVNVLDAQKSVRLVERRLVRSEKTLTLDVSLHPASP
ncbi:MAG: M56 family metallopeptidase [Planctomyces sp.]|nr:M56 family metallopeptidase [Planctomyces sp.]